MVLKTTEIYSFTVFEAKCLKAKSQQGHAPFKGSRKNPSCLFQLLVAAIIPRYFLTCGHILSLIHI